MEDPLLDTIVAGKYRVLRKIGEGGMAFIYEVQHTKLLRSFAPVVLVPRSVQGRRNPMEGWISADYGRQQPAPVVVYSARAPLPLRILTVIVPSADPTAPPPSVDPLVRREGLVGVVFDGDEVVVDDADPGFRRAAVGAEIR